MQELNFQIKKAEEKDLKRICDFLCKAIGAKKESLGVQTYYLKWKYFSNYANKNLLLYLELQGKILAVVGGIVCHYIINNREYEVCFPVDWFSCPFNPIKKAGQKVMRSLIEKFPLSIAVGGSKVCFKPQIKVGFKDVGDVLILGIVRKNIKNFPMLVKRWIFHPQRMWKGINLGKRAIFNIKPEFLDYEISNIDFYLPQLIQLFSKGIPKSILKEKWQYFMQQPCNPSRIIAFKFKNETSYALICEFTDIRQGYLGLVDVLMSPKHRVEEIFSVFAAYAWGKNKSAIFMTNNHYLITLAKSLGYNIYAKLRTQYFSSIGLKFYKTEELPAISFLSLDELGYRYKPNEFIKNEGNF